MRMHVALVHVDDDCSAVFLLLQRLRVLVDVTSNEGIAIGRRLVDEMFLAVLVSERMQPAVHRTLRNGEA